MSKTILGIKYGISKKEDGNMKIISEHSSDEMERRKIFLLKKNLDISELVTVVAKHENKVLTVQDKQNANLNSCDALVTDREDIILGVTVADCLPVYFFDDNKKVIGIAHAGWRGLSGGILQNTVLKMKEEYGVNPRNLNVMIGPHIQLDSYEVGPEVVDVFKNTNNTVTEKEGRYFLSLSNIAVQTLESAGVCRGKIEVSKEDTFKSVNYFSYRRDKPSEVEAMLAYIKLA